MIPSAIRALFKETCSFLIETAVGEDAYGGSVTTTFSQLCRVEWKQRHVTNMSGQQTISSATIYTNDIPALNGETKVILPSGETKSIVSVARPLWPNGARHLEVMV